MPHPGRLTSFSSALSAEVEAELSFACTGTGTGTGTGTVPAVAGFVAILIPWAFASFLISFSSLLRSFSFLSSTLGPPTFMLALMSRSLALWACE
jgi:hypothetical protein